MAKLHDKESNLNLFNFRDSLFDISMPCSNTNNNSIDNNSSFMNTGYNQKGS
jgi:hypothetical protein